MDSFQIVTGPCSYLFQVSYGSKPHLRRRLTYPTDRLPAILGLAMRFGRTIPGNRYLSGLWQNDTSALLWYARPLHEGPSLPNYHKAVPVADDDFIAPTWSWAKTDTQIDFIDLSAHRGRSYHSFKGHIKEETEHDNTVQVCTRELVVEGPVDYCTYESYYKSNSNYEYPALVFQNLTRWDKGSREYNLWFDWDYRNIDPMPGLCLLRLADVADGNIFLILQLVETPPHSLYFTHTPSDQSTEALPRYRRLGLLNVTKYRDFGTSNPGLGPTEIHPSELPQTLFTESQTMILI